MEYDYPLFRPPSEANSLIIQVTSGCSWNKCAFCEMYTSKKFKIRNQDEILHQIQALSPYKDQIKKVFLADGNAMVLSAERLLKIIETLKEQFPRIRRISSYALTADILRKNDNEIKELSDAGLDLLYVGIESGSDKVLEKVNKSESFDSTMEGLIKARHYGIKLSVMILNGLGGKELYEEHALKSAELVSKIQPEYLSTLVLSFPYGLEHFKKRLGSEFSVLNKRELLKELEIFIKNLNLEKSIYRSDHASNYLILKGILNADKEKLLERISFALDHPEILREEHYRGL